MDESVSLDGSAANNCFLYQLICQLLFKVISWLFSLKNVRKRKNSWSLQCCNLHSDGVDDSDSVCACKQKAKPNNSFLTERKHSAIMKQESTALKI